MQSNSKYLIFIWYKIYHLSSLSSHSLCVYSIRVCMSAAVVVVVVVVAATVNRWSKSTVVKQMRHCNYMIAFVIWSGFIFFSTPRLLRQLYHSTVFLLNFSYNSHQKISHSEWNWYAMNSIFLNFPHFEHSRIELNFDFICTLRGILIQFLYDIQYNTRN